MKNDGSLSWIMISRGTNKYVEEVYEEKGELSHHEEMASGTGIGKPIATEQRGQSSPPAYLPSKMFTPVDQRKWNGIPPASDVMKGTLAWRVSKIVTRVLRHHGVHREDDGAIDWIGALCYLGCAAMSEKKRPGISRLRLDFLQRGSDKKRFQCLPGFRRSHSLHACHPRSLWRNKWPDPAPLDNVEIPPGCTGCLCHVGCSSAMHSIPCRR